MSSQQIPKEIRQVIADEENRRKQLLADSLRKIEENRSRDEKELEDAFQAFYAPVESLVPEYMRPYASLPQQLGKDKIPAQYHFRQHNPCLAFDIPGIAPIIAFVKMGSLVYIIPYPQEADWGKEVSLYWEDSPKEIKSAGDALLAAQIAQKEYEEKLEALARRAEERKREQQEQQDAVNQLAERIAEDPIARLLALIALQTQAERHLLEQAIEEAIVVGESRARRAEMRCGLERLEKSLRRTRKATSA